jgi:hypothetical protein
MFFTRRKPITVVEPPVPEPVEVIRSFPRCVYIEHRRYRLKEVSAPMSVDDVRYLVDPIIFVNQDSPDRDKLKAIIWALTEIIAKHHGKAAADHPWTMAGMIVDMLIDNAELRKYIDYASEFGRGGQENDVADRTYA